MHLRNSSIPTGDLVRPGDSARRRQRTPPAPAQPRSKGKFHLSVKNISLGRRTPFHPGPVTAKVCLCLSLGLVSHTQPLQEERPSGQTEAGQWPLSTKTMASSASPGDGKRTTSQLPLPSPASLPQISLPSGNKGSELNTRPEVGGRKPGTCRPLATSSRLAQRRRRSVPFQSTTSGGRGGGRTRSLFNNNDGTVRPSRRTEQGGVLGGRVGTRSPGASTPPRAHHPVACRPGCIRGGWRWLSGPRLQQTARQGSGPGRSQG